ncbi:hypothetical protein KA093_02250 [Candidatus Saccharibacteria bacterium]|nr:hypothetical protein [Candidatus Saccharibacteria bacterium]
MSRIVEELERQGIELTYDNIAIYAVFVSEEGLVERLGLNEDIDVESSWLKELFVAPPCNP